MPSTIVKLSSSDARAWTHNQPVWLDEHGDVARAVTREEQHAISKALERSSRIKQSFRAELPLLPLNHTGRRTLSQRRPGAGGPPPMLDAAFEIQYVGEKRVVTIWNGPRRYATGREVLAARLLADHGECVLHGRNGKCIGVLRDPFVREREPQTGSRVQWSRNPTDPRRSEAQRSDLTEAADVSRVSSVRRRKKRALVTRMRKELYSPSQCPNDCRGMRGGQPWKIGDAAQPPTEQEHHPFCKYAAAWAATLETVQTTEVLYDLETSTAKRPAMPNEIAEADENEKVTGLRQVTVAGRVYAVLSPKDAEQAALEARGELAAGDEGAEDHLDLSADDEDVEDAGDDDTAEAAGPHVVPTGASTSGDRSEWPTLDELNPRGQRRSVGAVSARDYLTRPAGSESRSP